MKTARKGVGRFTIEIEGKAAHSGVAPSSGASAILELAHQIIKIHALNDVNAGTTLNVGVVHGGTVPNVVAARAVFGAVCGSVAECAEKPRDAMNAVLGRFVRA